MLAGAGAAACQRSRPPLVTHFQAESACSLRYPPTWSARLAEQGTLRYRYFESPPAGPQRQTLTATLISVPLASSLENYGEVLLAGARIEEKRDEARGRARGRRLRAVSADGAIRHSLLLLQEGNRAYGLHTQGQTAAFVEKLSDVETIEDSFALERVEDYAETRNADWAFALRVPASWRPGRTLAGGGTYLTQFLSPPLAIDPGGHTVHASLTLTVEPAPGDGTVEAFRSATHKKLGDAFQLVGFQEWRDGTMEILQTETSVSVSRSKRFYRTANGRAYGLAFEAREDVFVRVSRWCDLIASTLRVGTEAGS
jgi:hypothetical protein